MLETFETTQNLYQSLSRATSELVVAEVETKETCTFCKLREQPFYVVEYETHLRKVNFEDMMGFHQADHRTKDTHVPLRRFCPQLYYSSITFGSFLLRHHQHTARL